MSTEGNAPAVQPAESVTPAVVANDPSPAELHSRKLLDEKKKIQQERDQLLAEKRERDEADARKRGDYEALIKAREEALAVETSKRKALEESFERGQKLNAVVDALGGNLESKWYKLIDVSKIPINPETGEVDAASVSSVVESLKREWPEMVKAKGALPAAAPMGENGAPGKISESAWKRLPNTKEQSKYGPNDIVWGS